MSVAFSRRMAALLFAVIAGPLLAAQPPVRPNVLVILADDMGFSDAGCYGGEIPTPHLDRLASNGVRFTQFYNTSRCWPTRAALLSGYYPQQIRMDPPRGRLPEWAHLLPHRLRPLGYRSYHSGKWHVSGAPLPLSQGGFDRSYRLEDPDRNFNPSNHWRDDVRLPPVPKGSNYYTTVAIADFMIDCLREHQRGHSERPFFGYLAFTVPHFPLQALPDDIERHRDRYLAGWEAIRRQRYDRQVRMGLVRCALSPMEQDSVPHWNLSEQALREQISSNEVARAVSWDELSEGQRRFQATKMAIHAAMIERMDREIGRVLEQIKAMGVLENTVVMFASDNGASAEFLNRGDQHDSASAPGSAASFLCLGPGWSSVANTPFRLHKSWVHEGGISTPFIVQWPRGIRARGELRHGVGHVIDIVPTVLEIVGVAPITAQKGQGSPPLPGHSLTRALARDVPIPRESLYFHHENNRALVMGEWKLVSRRPDTNAYALYHLGRDRSEQVDLAAREPGRVARMAERWRLLEEGFRKEANAPLPQGK